MNYIIIIIELFIIAIPLWIHFHKKPTQVEPVLREGDKMDKDQLKDCLSFNNSWIDNCDQKAGILLGTMGVAMTIFLTSDALKVFRQYIFLPFLQWYENNQSMQFNWSRFLVFMWLVIVATMASTAIMKLLKSISPNINYNQLREKNPTMVKKSYLFYGSVANMEYEEFKTAKFDYEEDLRSQVFTNAYIAYNKFKSYADGLFWFKMTLMTSAILFIHVMLMR